jgi:hypothetical protein
MRIVVMTVVVLATVVIAAGRSARIGQRHTFAASVMIGSAIGFVVDPASWDGHAYVAQLIVGAGPLAGLVDFLILLALTGAISVTLGARLVHRDDHAVRGNSYVGEGTRS